MKRQSQKQYKFGVLNTILAVVLGLLTILCLTIGLLSKAPTQSPVPAPIPTDTEPSQKEDTPLPDTSEEDEQAKKEAEEKAKEEAARLAHAERAEGIYTILVSGVDDNNGGSDTNILLSINTTRGFIYGVSIPRDTKASVKGKTAKINSAYNSGGMELLASTVSEQLGIPIDYTVNVNLKGFAALVDSIGGIDFYVPCDMDYDDPIQNLAIHYTKGTQHLSGQQALEVVRFRHNNDGTGYGSEDVGRMNTQQNFLRAVAKKMLTPSSLTRVSDYAEIFKKYVKTELTAGNLVWLGQQAIQIGVNNIAFSTLPSEWVSPYMKVKPEETLNLINTYLNPYKEARTLEDLNIL